MNGVDICLSKDGAQFIYDLITYCDITRNGEPVPGMVGYYTKYPEILQHGAISDKLRAAFAGGDTCDAK